MVHVHTISRIVLALLIAAGTVALAFYHESFTPSGVVDWVAGHAPWSAVVFVFAYALSSVFLLPGSIPTLVGGALFGPVLGTALNLMGATLGATLSFATGRYLAHDLVRRHAGPRVTALLQGSEQQGWRLVAFLRLAPVFPYFVVNYALGLTHLRAWTYIWASLVFMLPGTAAFTYLGWAGLASITDSDKLVHLIVASAVVGVVILGSGIWAQRNRRLNRETP